MIRTTQKGRASDAAVETASGVLASCRTELEWMAVFVIGDEESAAACATEGCESLQLTETAPATSLVQLAGWRTLESAIDSQRVRIHQLVRFYERRTCEHKSHDPLPTISVDFAVQETALLLKKLDVLSRCALLLCGMQDRSPEEAAKLLGVSERCVYAAYCAAVEFLETAQCDRFRQENEFAAVWN